MHYALALCNVLIGSTYTMSIIIFMPLLGNLTSGGRLLNKFGRVLHICSSDIRR